MSAILGSLAPVFILIMLGYVIRNAFRLKQPFWEKLEWLVYFLLFPSLIVHHLSQVSLIGTEFPNFSLALLLSTFLVSGLLLLAQRFMNVGGAAFTSIFMGSTRFNTYIGIAAAGSLYGETGLIIASVAIAVLVPQVNILSILVLTKFTPKSRQKTHWYNELVLIVSNPLILASGVGIILGITSTPLPPVIGRVIADLAAASIPLGLMAVGAGLQFKTIYTSKKSLAWAAIFKLLAMPLVTAVVCHIMNVDGLYAKIALLFASLPSASTAYILSRQLGGDAPLMAAIITATTLLAAATMPVILVIL
jgi:predicted permease